MKPMFALVDGNTFYASCEAVFRPSLWGKPVIVLSNNDGCIISRNKEAKALGIPELVPFFQVRRRVEALGIQIFSSNYELYGDLSGRMMRILDTMAEDMEVYSIDEAFLQLSRGNYPEHARAIRDQVLQQVGLPVCVGLGPTKTLAKLANKAAKKIPKFKGVCVLDEPLKWEWLLARISPDKLWGVGSRITARLDRLGIKTALQLAQADRKWLRRHFSVVLEKTIMQLNGEPCLELELAPDPKQEIICSRSFSYKVTELHELQQAITQYATRACEKLREQNSLTADILVYLESFDKQAGDYHPQRLAKLPCPTNDTRIITHLATTTLAPMFRSGRRYKKCGIVLLDIRPQLPEQQDLFAPQQPEQSRRLMGVLDKVNQRYGKHTMQLAGGGLNAQWKMKREYMSPRYTTRWNELPVVRC